MKLTRKLILAALLALGLVGANVHAESEPGMVESPEEAEEIMEERSEFMKGMGSAMRAFSNFLKRGDGEPLELAAMADEIGENADRIPSLFPLNTGIELDEDSEALPIIWEEWDDFVARSGVLVELADAVEDAFESGDPNQIGASVKGLGQNGCRNCHIKFRKPKN